MYQKKFLVIMAIIAALSFSCNKKEAPPSSSHDGSSYGESDNSGSLSGNIGYTLRVNTSFYTLESDTGEESDKTKWAASIRLGERVEVKKARKLTFGGDGKVWDFLEIRLENGNEGYAFATQVAAGGRLAVVTDDKANLYSSSSDFDVTGSVLPRKVVVVIYPETERDGIIEIRAYNPVAQLSIIQSNKNNFIRRSSLSEKTSDIQSSILLQTAEPLKDEGSEKNRKDALLETARTRYPDSAFSADIEALTIPRAAVIIETESASNGFMTVDDDNVNVRDLPDAVAGRVLGQVSRGIVVTVSEQTKETSTIGGHTARWYHIIEPLDGWIFGEFLE
jgi:uncharacterized protein YgiM (DUF1202 family)